MNIKKYIYNVIQPAEKGSIISKIFDLFIMAFILFSVASVFIMTFPVSAKTIRLMSRIEEWSLIIFSVEYLLRIWTADYLFPNDGKIKSRLKYMVSGMALIDLIAILPFFLPMFLPVNLVGIRAFRLIRLLRIFKLHRYTAALASIGEVFKKKSQEILVSIFFVSILLVISSLLIYYAEHDAQPKQFSNAFSGLWWAVATLTTVGYGDIYPVTVLGRILGTVIALMGIGMVAVPTGILSAGFVEYLEQKQSDTKETDKEEEKKYCPHCGKKL
ncbi:MAG: ion transporter [Lentisphaeria bacterium]|nr:ion transporter [Lentisphaeria bacterium]